MWLLSPLALPAADIVPLHWKQLAPLPDQHGFAGMFAGVGGGKLLAAGGANFPEKPPWEQGTKVWYDRIYWLDDAGAWQLAEEKLPRPLGYGVSLNWRDWVICLGGSDATRHYADVFGLQWRESGITFRPFPPLPRPCANMAGALVGDILYIAGGTTAPASTTALKSFWALDLSRPQNQLAWEELPAWDGPERFQSVAASASGKLYLFGGIRLQQGNDGKPERILPYLKDAWCYTPGSPGRWERLADAPTPLAAAPCPAPVFRDSLILIAAGVDGTQQNIPQATHPGFRRDTFLYELKTGAWKTGPLLPEGSSRVTVPATPWGRGWAIVSGESRPGVRSPQVWQVQGEFAP